MKSRGLNAENDTRHQVTLIIWKKGISSTQILFYILMFTKYKVQEPVKVECYYVVLYEQKKGQDVKFMELCRKDIG